MFAAMSNNTEMAGLLLKHNPLQKSETKFGKSALDYAFMYGFENQRLCYVNFVCQNTHFGYSVKVIEQVLFLFLMVWWVAFNERPFFGFNFGTSNTPKPWKNNLLMYYFAQALLGRLLHNLLWQAQVPLQRLICGRRLPTQALCRLSQLVM